MLRTYPFFAVIVFFMGANVVAQAVSVPFSTGKDHLTIWNGRDYEPFFIKGMNLGVSVPGKFPGELSVSRSQYGRWFRLIKDAGYNSIRLYTLHYPDFYEVLDSFNFANPHNPLFFFQGVWLEEEMEGFDNDLFFLTEAFLNEIEENVDGVHGNRTIGPRRGKAHGTYTANVSRWNMGYIIGREVHPGEVAHTNNVNSGYTSFAGDHFAISGVLPVEAWIVSKLNHLVWYENLRYNTQRPVSFSSWPTQDPLSHTEEWNPWEDSTSIDLSKIELINAPAGFFISYHAYPYYPHFINYGLEYIGFSDNYGPNSYLGYLKDLKDYYQRFPLIIAETGVPSSWGIAHYSTSGLHHGGFDDYQQGEANMRILETVESAGCGGAMHFSWMDEWFKRTWVTDHIDYLMDRRVLWHNITAAEQNFGLIGFQRPLSMGLWDEFCNECEITYMTATADFDFFHMKLHMKVMPRPTDDFWIAFDTYNADLGESILPNGKTIGNRAEFALHLTNYSAKLYVTQAYDLYGIFHGVSEPEQQYRSVVSNGAPWNIVRWKVNEFDQDIQYIGNLKVNYGFLPATTRDAVTIHKDHIHIRIPWSLLHFVDPSTYVVFHDNRSTWQPEDTISDGIIATIFHRNREYVPSKRFIWEKWNHALDVQEVIKGSYWVIKDRMREFNNRAIAFNDSLYMLIDEEPAWVNAEQGVLANDFDLDGNYSQAILITPPKNGRLVLLPDGSFTYEPWTNFVGEDIFTYAIFDGRSISEPATVKLNVEVIAQVAEVPLPSASEPIFTVYPNPASNFITINSEYRAKRAYIFGSDGRLVLSNDLHGGDEKIDISSLDTGVYIAMIDAEGIKFGARFIVNR